ncbi:Uncharacterised protein [Mycobacteroides abscessus subsp. abscessus]|nr:Uncharacterised protein [Mycobacteroides abscessus subsp. abscessus]
MSSPQTRPEPSTTSIPQHTIKTRETRNSPAGRRAGRRILCRISRTHRADLPPWNTELGCCPFIHLVQVDSDQTPIRMDGHAITNEIRHGLLCAGLHEHSHFAFYQVLCNQRWNIDLSLHCPRLVIPNNMLQAQVPTTTIKTTRQKAHTPRRIRTFYHLVRRVRQACTKRLNGLHTEVVRPTCSIILTHQLIPFSDKSTRALRPALSVLHRHNLIGRISLGSSVDCLADLFRRYAELR